MIEKNKKDFLDFLDFLQNRRLFNELIDLWGDYVTSIVNFGHVQFGYKSAEKRLKHYRKYVYEAGALERPDGKYVKLIDPNVLKKEQRKIF